MSIIPSNNIAIFFQNYTITASQNCAVEFSTISANPSSSIGNRIWNLNIALSCSKTQEPYILFIDLKNVDDRGYQITFEGKVYGTITYRNVSLNAGKYVTYEYDSIAKTITVYIEPLPCIREQSDEAVFVSLFINDGGCQTCQVQASSNETYVIYQANYTLEYAPCTVSYKTSTLTFGNPVFPSVYTNIHLTQSLSDNTYTAILTILSTNVSSSLSLYFYQIGQCTQVSQCAGGNAYEQFGTGAPSIAMTITNNSNINVMINMLLCAWFTNTQNTGGSFYYNGNLPVSFTLPVSISPNQTLTYSFTPTGDKNTYRGDPSS
jgi:hypothetical protein